MFVLCNKCVCQIWANLRKKLFLDLVLFFLIIRVPESVHTSLSAGGTSRKHSRNLFSFLQSSNLKRTSWKLGKQAGWIQEMTAFSILGLTVKSSTSGRCSKLPSSSRFAGPRNPISKSTGFVPAAPSKCKVKLYSSQKSGRGKEAWI